MNKRSLTIASFAALAFVLAFPVAAYADTEINDKALTFSYSKFIPVFLGASFVIDALLIMFLAKLKRIVTVSYATLVANIVSMLAIRLILGFRQGEVFYAGMLSPGSTSFNYLKTGFCVAVSLIVELPILWLMLKDFIEDTLRLMIVAAFSNVLTAAAIAFVEIQINNWLIS